MRALFLVVAVATTACANVQDLGVTPPATDARPVEPSSQPTTPPPPPLVPPTPAQLVPCPSSAPVDGARCGADVGWCSYRVDPAGGLAAKCACGVDSRWTCLLVRDDDRRNPLPAAAMPLTAASCTEGAPCAEGVRCTLSGASPRTCSCTSAGILLCTRPAQ